MDTPKPHAPSSPKHTEEPDSELSELVETFQKIQHSLPSTAKGPTSPETLDYVTAELDNIQRKQALIQQQIEGKNKEIVTLRETLLVVSGALQGLQHIHKFMTKEGTEPSSLT
jgi:hypothetical protein